LDETRISSTREAKSGTRAASCKRDIYQKRKGITKTGVRTLVASGRGVRLHRVYFTCLVIICRARPKDSDVACLPLLVK